MNLLNIHIILYFLIKLSLSTIHKIHLKKNNFLYNSIKNSLLRNLSQINILGNSSDLNYYYTYLYLGNSKQRQSYIIDTGSSITTSPCKPYCNRCGKHENNYYEIDESDIIKCGTNECDNLRSSCKNNMCSFSISYSEGSSLNGIFSNQIIRLKENDDNEIEEEFGIMPIGCTSSETNLFVTQLADGIMGLSNENTNFINQLYNYHIIKNNIFSLCLSQKGGYFSISDIETTYHLESNISYVSLLSNRFYYIKINKIKINQNEIIISNNAQGFIDSGTTISYFPKNYSDFIINEIKQTCELKDNKKYCGKYKYMNDLGSCFIFENKNYMEITINEIWPNISFYLDGYIYVWTPLQYFFNYSYDYNYIGCVGYNSVNENRFTLGSTWMHGHDLIFDRNKNKVGFVEANCDREEVENKYIPRDIWNEIENKKIFVVKNIYFNWIYICIIIVLVLVVLILGIAVHRLRRGKNFLCFYVINNNLNEINIIRLNNENEKNINNNIIDSKYRMIDTDKNNTVELIVNKTNEIKNKNNEEEENKNLKNNIINN